MRKIDKTLKEVRSWKRKVSDKTRGMTTKEVVAYFRAAPRPGAKKPRAA